MLDPDWSGRHGTAAVKPRLVVNQQEKGPADRSGHHHDETDADQP
jgi:hypothetical protein